MNPVFVLETDKFTVYIYADGLIEISKIGHQSITANAAAWYEAGNQEANRCIGISGKTDPFSVIPPLI